MGGTFDHNEQQVGEDMYYFLQAFFKQFPDYNKNFFVFGESYGGHYVPSVTYRIWQGNNIGNTIKIDLKGWGVGNGLTDPLEQYKWYPEMAYNSGTAPPAVSKLQYKIMKAAVKPCINKIATCNGNSTSATQACV